MTQFTNYDRQLFEYQPTNFLAKPIDILKVQRILDYIIENRTLSSDYFKYKVNGKIATEKKSKIMFFQIQYKQINIQKINGEEENFYGCIEKVSEELKKDEFIRIHKSYLVNYKYIKSFSAKSITLYNGKELPISRKYSKEVREFLIKNLR